MRLHLISLSFASVLLSITHAFLPPTLSLSPLAAQTHSQQYKDRKADADRLFQEGLYRYARDNFERALKSFSEALLIYQQIGDKAGIGKTLQYIGSISRHREEYEQALDYYQRALPIQREVGDSEGERLTLKFIGEVYDTQGDQLAAQSQ